MASSASTFAEMLRRHRLATGLTQEALAERSGLSSRGIQDLERGARTAPRAETVRLLCDALALDAEQRAAMVAAANPELASPATPATARRQSTLPAPPTALVGREREVATACALLRRPHEVDGSRLLTITGPGGVGKTRLALAVAHELAAECADGAVWVELAPLHDPNAVPAALARALQVPDDGEWPIADAVAAAVAERDLLLVLDNCEHLLAATPLLSQLLAAAPRLVILATSRTRLRLRGERELPLGPLAVPELDHARAPIAGLAGVAAVRLFVERAQAVAPSFTLTDESAPAVAAICRRLDGLPLALELAAARAKVLPPVQLLELLERRLPLLSGGARDLPVRQQTMRDAIAWSYQLLSPEEQALFRRLTVFTGGFTLEAAEAIRDQRSAFGSEHPITLDLITSLVDQSLLRSVAGSGEGPRFAMLETMREFGLEQLAARGELDEVCRAHALAMLAIAEAAEPHLGGAAQARWLDRLEREADNMREAMRWAAEAGHADLAARLAAALWPFWRIRGHVRDGRAWLERLLAPSTNAIPALLRARLLDGLGTLAAQMGDFDVARSRLDASLALRRDLDDWRGVASALQSLALVAQHQRDYARSAALYAQSLEIARQHEDGQAIVVALNGLAIAAQFDGDVDRAAALYEESLAAARRLGTPRYVAIALGNLGNLAADQGDAERAASLYEASLATYREIGDLRGIGICLYSLGQQAVTRGDPRAGDLLAEALLIFVDLGDQSAIAETLDLLALLMAERGEPRSAARLLGTTASLRERTGIPAPTDPHYRADYDRVVSLVDAALGPEALASARAAVRDVPLEEIVAEALRLLSAFASLGQGAEERIAGREERG